MHSFFSEFSYNDKWGHLIDQRAPLQAKANLSSRPQLSDDKVEI